MTQGPKRVLVFEAHGDDMEFFARCTIVGSAALGHEIALVARHKRQRPGARRAFVVSALP